MKHRFDAPARYFRRVYPVLRGARGGTRVASHVTEPGQNDRLAWVLAELGDTPQQSVLDAGCGLGTYTVALAARGHHVTAVDLSEAMLLATERAARAAGVADRIELVQGDLRTWIPNRSFTTVLSLGVAEYYPDAVDMLERLYACAARRMLVTWSAADVGPRSMIRRAWLGLHGLNPPLLRPAELDRMLSRLPCANVQVSEMYWTHCAVVARPPSGPQTYS